MGTRCLTFVFDESEKPILCLYRQFDGYPDGHGIALADFLKDMSVVNGIRFGEEEKKIANGMGCLAAQVVAHFKEVPGGFYVVAPNLDHKEDYVYHVHHHCVNVYTYSNRLLFSGPWTGFYDFCVNFNPN